MNDQELREMVNPLSVPCPYCHAKSGVRCHSRLFGNWTSAPHPEREKKALSRFKEIFNLP